VTEGGDIVDDGRGDQIEAAFRSHGALLSAGPRRPNRRLWAEPNLHGRKKPGDTI
jgi:hypothetical protein